MNRKKKVMMLVVIFSLVLIPTGSLFVYFSRDKEQGRQIEQEETSGQLLIEFKPINYTLEVNCTEGGVAYMVFLVSNSSRELPNIYTSYYKEEFCQYEQVMLEPYAFSGWQFSHFSGDLNATRDDYIEETETTRQVRMFNILMDSDKQITLHFEKI